MDLDVKILGRSPAVIELRQTIRSVAPTDLRVLIRGETGTGKELVAQSIHELGRQSKAGYVAVNCAELTAGLAPSTLFGHLRGSYTDARWNRRGVFDLANGGTLLFDEIGDLSPDVQGMLLRVLETGEFTPLGAERPVRTTFRLVSATHRNLERMVEIGEFRRDLLHRIAEATVFVPPLRERLGDIPLLARHFLSEAARVNGVDPAILEDGAAEVLRRQPWPGNVRELKNRMRLMAVRRSARPVAPEDVEPAVEPSPADPSEEVRILKAIREAGTIGAAARSLGMHRTTLWRKMSILGLRRSYAGL